MYGWIEEKPMSVFTARRGRALLGASALSAGLLANGLVAPRHAAAYGFCRSDPIVTLNNGLIVHLSATIGDTPSDITGVAYTMHAPVGTSVVSVVYPPDPNNIPQTFQFVADNPAGVWDSYTYVDTKTTGIGVTATAEIANLIVFAATGADHQQVRVHVQQGGQGGGDGTSAATGASAPTGGGDTHKGKGQGGDGKGNNN